MFDRTVVVARSQPTHQYTTVTEKRAPTDESVRLLKDMEREAQGKLVEAVRLEDNGFECVVQHFYEGWSDETKYVALFSLNGKKMKATFTASPLLDKRDVAKGIRDKIAETIANEAIPALGEALRLRLGALRA